MISDGTKILFFKDVLVNTNRKGKFITIRNMDSLGLYNQLTI